MFWTGAKGLLYSRRKTDVFRKWNVVLQAYRGKCIQKGQLLVIFVAVGIWNFSMLIKSFEKCQSFCICPKLGMLIENSNLSQSFLFSKNSALSKKAPHSHNIIATLLQSVITYCYQKNPLRVRTKPHIRLCYAWSLQRFKSLPSILCEKAVCA